MNSLLPLLILLILGVIYVGTSGDNNSLIGIFAIIIALLFFFMIDNQNNVEQFTQNLNACGYNDPRNTANYWAQIQNDMGNTDNYANRMILSDPDPAVNYPPSSTVLFTPPSSSEDVSVSDASPNDMFMFAHNQASPECCPSTYSTSTGCICTTQQQRDMINRRGGNRSAPSHF